MLKKVAPQLLSVLDISVILLQDGSAPAQGGVLKNM